MLHFNILDSRLFLWT